MEQYKLQNIVFNICIVLNCLLVFLLIFYSRIEAPTFLQVFGRAHPLALHFPIVLILLAFLFEIDLAYTKRSLLRNTANWLLLFGAFTTVAACLMGIFLSKEDGYEGNEVNLHKWAGVICSLISTFWYGFRYQIRKHKLITTFTGASLTIVLLIAGHKGANITHGQDFLFAPIKSKDKIPAVLLEDGIVYDHLVQPIFEKKCISCHNNDKARGELIMQTRELLLKGGKSGKLWDTSLANMGLMMERIHLPPEHKEHMPPNGKTQLSEEEARILYYWIKGGARFTQKVTELPEQDSLRLIANSHFITNDVEEYDFKPISESIVAGLNTEYRIITPLAQESPALAVNFYGVSQFESNLLKDLEKIKDNIVALHLSKMPLKDDDLKIIGSFSNLRDLNISFTGVKGDGLKYLSGLTHLKQLSFSGTSVNSGNLRQLAQLKSLKSIKAWNTLITEKDIASLQKSFANTNFDLGYSGDTVIVELNTPVITATKGKRVFDASTVITIMNPVKEAMVLYTTDGSEPDSLTSPKYEKPFTIKNQTTVKAKAFLKGWISSKPASAVFFKRGIKPDSVSLARNPHARYIGNVKKGNVFIDELLGTTNSGSPEWIGYRDDLFEMHLFFKQPVDINKVTFSALINIGDYIMPSAVLEVWGGKDMSSISLLAHTNPQQPGIDKPAYLAGYECELVPTQKVNVVKLVAKQVKHLPAWIPGKGQKAWIFFDEVFIY